MNLHRNLLVIFNTGLLDEDGIRQETQCLQQILLQMESVEQFCIAHELVDRNRITSRKNKMIAAARHYRLRPFRFFINKN